MDMGAPVLYSLCGCFCVSQYSFLLVGTVKMECAATAGDKKMQSNNRSKCIAHLSFHIRLVLLDMYVHEVYHYAGLDVKYNSYHSLVEQRGFLVMVKK